MSAFFCFLTLASLFSLPKHVDPIQVEIRPEVYAEHTFPAGHPPPHPIQALPGLEAGWCDTQMHEETRVELSGARLAGLSASVSLIQFTASMHVTVWVEEGAAPNVAPHEATHRAISEHYYAMSDAVARSLAQEVAHRKVKLSWKNRQRTLEQAADDIIAEVNTAFNWAIWSRCQFAQDRFDEITDHGRDPITNADAMKQALADEAAHWAQVKDHPTPPDEASSLTLPPLALPARR